MNRLILSILCPMAILGSLLLSASSVEAQRTSARNIYGVRSSKNIYGVRGGRPNLSSNKFYAPQGQGRGLRHNYFGSPYASERQADGGSTYLAPNTTSSWGYWDYDLEQERKDRQTREQEHVNEGSIGNDIVRF